MGYDTHFNGTPLFIGNVHIKRGILFQGGCRKSFPKINKQRLSSKVGIWEDSYTFYQQL